MKKYAIAVIGLVFAVFVFGACESDSGGTIKVTNASDNMYVDIYVTKSSGDTTPPTTGVMAERKNMEPGATENINLPEGGPYYVKPFFLIKEHNEEGVEIIKEERPGTANKSMIYLFGGDTEEVRVTP